MACAACECGSEERWLYGGGNDVLPPLVLASGGLCESGAAGAGVWGHCEAAGVVMGVAGAWLGGAAGCAAECADLCIGTRGRNIERQGRGNSGKHSGLE